MRSRGFYLVVGEEWACQGRPHGKSLGKTVLITSANHGIGRALIEEAFRRGSKRVSVTNTEQIGRAARQVGNLDVPINNAGIALYDDLTLLC